MDKLKALRIPKAEIVTCDTHYGIAYAWKIESIGLIVLGDTQRECNLKFIEAVAEEYPRQYTYAGGILA